MGSALLQTDTTFKNSVVNLVLQYLTHGIYIKQQSLPCAVR